MKRIYDAQPTCYRVRLAREEEAQLRRYSSQLDVSVPALIRAIVHGALLAVEQKGSITLEFGHLELGRPSRRTA